MSAIASYMVILIQFMPKNIAGAGFDVYGIESSIHVNNNHTQYSYWPYLLWKSN